MTRQSVIWRASGLTKTVSLALAVSCFFLSSHVFSAEDTTQDRSDSELPASETRDRTSKPTPEKASVKSTVSESARDAPRLKASRPVASDQGESDKTSAKSRVREVLEKAEEEKEDLSERIKHVIGSTAKVLETQSQILFLARVDTGAQSCSVHFEEIEVEDEAKKMEDNIGKSVRFLLNNGADQTYWVESKIERCVTIKTSEEKERRYKVPMTFRVADVEKTVVVTLNDRGHMRYPVLLGRNFLSGDFLVDADLNGDD